MTQTNANALMRDFMVTLSDLCSVLDAETQALRLFNLEGAASLQDMKTLMAGRFCEQANLLKDNRDLVRQEFPDAEAKLAAESKRLGSCLSENLKAVQNAKDSNQRVISLIVDTARQAINPGRGYTLKPFDSSSTGRVSLACNQRL